MIKQDPLPGHMTATCKDRRQLKLTLAKLKSSTQDSAAIPADLPFASKLSDLLSATT